MTEGKLTPRTAAVPVYAFSFLSGIAALIYEVTWAKMLSLTFGSTTLSAAAVVAGFMGGMGLGAWLYHLLNEWWRARPLVFYGVIEIGIALSTALLTLTFYSLPRIFAGLAGVIPEGGMLDVTRFVSVFILLLIPSALMGATFPALCTVMINTARGVDRYLGMIYGINTIGAACGALIAGLFLLEMLGLSSSVLVANAINIAIGLTAFALLGTRIGRGDWRATPPEEASIPTFLPRAVTGLVLFLSGFCTLSYEIVWFRALRYLVGTSIHAFTIVLFIFLVGLGLGSLLLRRVARRQSPERDLAFCHLGIAVLALLSMACQVLLLSMPSFHSQVSIFSSTVHARPWPVRLMIDAGIAVVTMLPATIFMGLSFPLATRLFLGDVRKLDKRVGGAYLLANVGSILGSIGGAALLLPLFGTIGGTKAAALVNLALAALVAAAIRRRVAGCAYPLTAAGIAVVALALFLPGALRLRGENIEGTMAGRDIFFEEGDLATVQVQEASRDPSKRVMTIDGYKIGWSDGFRGTTFYRKQVLLSHLPMILDSGIRRTLNVGLGSAATLKALAVYPEVDVLDCIEINGAVVRGADLFPESRILDDPRVNLIVDDAVHYLLKTDRKYDLIVSDGKQDPFYSGNAVLLCLEFYRYALDRLTEDGMLVQWYPLRTLHSDFRIVARTFCEVFPHVDVFFLPPDSVFMVGAQKPINGRTRRSSRSLQELGVLWELEAYNIDGPGALLAHWMAGRDQLMAVVGDVPCSTWDRLVLDFSPFKAAHMEWQTSVAENLAFLFEAEDTQLGTGGPAFLDEDLPFLRSKRLLREAFQALYRKDPLEARRLALQAREVNPADSAAETFLSRMGPR